jgi:phosphoribosylformimino-5-aminoimidazole carboxamide ribotide isomerase
MLVIPAIDLQDGCVVRDVQGARDKKIYSRDPVKTAKHWVKQGAKMIHVVDLDGAFTGVPKNLQAAKEIALSVNVPVQFGGGVRSIETVKSLIKAGLARVVLGTRAVEDKAFLKKAFSDFGERVIVSIDAKAGIVQVKGWKASAKGLDMLVFGKDLKKMGFKEAIFTDTAKDGTLSGPNIMAIKALLRETGLKVIASGGVSKLEDLYKLEKLEKSGLAGVIVGKALYEGRFTLTEAIKQAG